MSNKENPRFYVPCLCVELIEAELRKRKMVLPGLSRWSDKDGSNGFGLIFQSWGTPVRGKVKGGLVKLTYCPFCGKSFIDDRIILTDEENHDPRED